jgi:hypothetical protein
MVLVMFLFVLKKDGCENPKRKTTGFGRMGGGCGAKI